MIAPAQKDDRPLCEDCGEAPSAFKVVAVAMSDNTVADDRSLCPRCTKSAGFEIGIAVATTVPARPRRKPRLKVECQECGRRWSTTNDAPECPRCGSTHIDLATPKGEPKP